MKGLAGKVCIIAGGATGIGRGTAIRLAEEGVKVVVGDINATASEETAAMATAAAKLGGTAIAAHCDIADEVSVAAMVKGTVDRFGGVDAIHINANDMRVIAEDGDALSTSLTVFDRTIQVGLRGHLLCTRAALPEILKRGGGAIVYTASGSAYSGEATRVSYAVAKAGITALTRHVARRWGKDGVRANAIAPGLVVVTKEDRGLAPTGFRDQILSQTSSPRLGQPSDIAAMVAMLVSDDGAWINGQTISVDGGLLMRP